MPDDDLELAVARGGPLDGKTLGSADADRYEGRMADQTLHLYRRSDLSVPRGLLFHDEGRLSQQVPAVHQSSTGQSVVDRSSGVSVR